MIKPICLSVYHTRISVFFLDWLVSRKWALLEIRLYVRAGQHSELSTG